MKHTQLLRLGFLTVLSLLLSACNTDGEGQSPAPAISVTSLGDSIAIETADLFINLHGTAQSDGEITSVAWKNDRGGNGTAAGTENWSISRIRLQHGQNNVTLTARDVAGNSNSKTVTIQRETQAVVAPPESNEPTIMYSYSSDMRHAAPLANSTIDPGPVFLFLDPGKNWLDRGIGAVEYTCCESPGGQAQTVNASPWLVQVDVPPNASGDRRVVTIAGSFSDGQSGTESASADFVVAADSRPTNNAPVITGNAPASGAVGINYVFMPVSTDADSDSMSFSVENMPAWAVFNPLSGQLSGVPASKDVGLHGDIVISVSDGKATTSLEPFSIRVDAFAPGSATVSWIPPSQRTDNSPLVGLAGYDIHYGLVSGPLDNRITISNPGITSYVVDNLPSGNWRFMVTAYDSDGRLSGPSTEGIKRIP